MGLSEDGRAGGKQAGPRWPGVGAGPSREAAVEQCPEFNGQVEITDCHLENIPETALVGSNCQLTINGTEVEQTTQLPL